LAGQEVADVVRGQPEADGVVAHAGDNRNAADRAEGGHPDPRPDPAGEGGERQRGERTDSQLDARVQDGVAQTCVRNSTPASSNAAKEAKKANAAATAKARLRSALTAFRPLPPRRVCAGGRAIRLRRRRNGPEP